MEGRWSRPCPNRHTHPVEAGSANDYDYTSGDPVNSFDLDGECRWGNPFKRCKKKRRAESPEDAEYRQSKARDRAVSAGCRAASLLSLPPTDNYGAAISAGEALLPGALGRASMVVTGFAGLYYVFACTPSDPDAPGPFAGSNNVNEAGVPYRQN